MSLLQDIIDELNTGSYSADDITALNELKSSGIMTQGAAPAGQVLTYLAQIGKLKTVEDISNNDTHPLQNAAKAVVVTYSGRTEFEFHKASVQAMCQAFVNMKLDGTVSNGVDDGILTQTEKDNLEALGQTPRFTNATLKLIRQARGKTNTQTVNGWSGTQRRLKITVADTLFEEIRPTATYTDSDFTDSPLGRAGINAGNNVYIMDLTGLRPRGVGQITVELGAPNSFTLELV
jgi:hypothetical protein